VPTKEKKNKERSEPAKELRRKGKKQKDTPPPV
jgi:hypothetical protein